MAGLNYIDVNNWRYENYGTADLLSVSGTTLTNLPETQSKTGSAFYQTTRAKCFDLPATNEIWIKFDVYFDGSNRWRAYNTGSEDSCGVCSYASNLRLGMWRNGNNVQDFSGVCKKNTLQTVLLHMVSDSSAGVIEAWIDGNFIYRYTGNVNQGSDFADIYLQSDGSGTFFSNVIISNTQIELDEVVAELRPIYDIAIKSEIFISWIPMGQVGLKSQIYASYIPKPEKATADLFRIVSKSEPISADSLRKVTKSENNPADLLRKLTYSDTFPADTKRKVYQHEITSGDTFRRVVQSNIAAADSFRQVKKTEIATADTSRKMGITIATADTQRNIIVSTSATFDTCRKIGETNIFSADTYLRTARTDIARADSFREVIVTTVATADALRKIGVIESFAGDTSRTLGTTETSQADTFRQVTATEIAIADLIRALREVASYDTFRKVTQKEKAIASTVIRIPHIWNYFIKPTLRTTKLLADSQSLVNTFKSYGITAVNITLSERTLSDNFTFQTTKPININDAVQGSLLDYHFNFLVEEITQTELIREVKGRYNQDDLLYTQFFLPTTIIDYKEQVVLTSAWEYIGRIASHLHLSANRKFSNFTPYNLSGNSRITYSDLINSLFGWTSQLPQRQVNVFIRGSTLHCIQRGHEDSVFDISDLPHSRPTINKKLIRSLWSNPKGQDTDSTDSDSDADSDSDSDSETKTDTTPDDGNDTDPIIEYLYDEWPVVFSGTIPFSGDNCETTLTYKYGLLRREDNETYNDKATIESHVTYSYIEFFPNMSESEVSIKKTLNKNFYGDFYIGQKSLHVSSTTLENYDEVKDGTASKREYKKTEQYGTTEYSYNVTSGADIYLGEEYEFTTTYTYETNDEGFYVLADKQSDLRETFHVPLGNGWYGQSVYINGEAQGSNISQGKPGNRVSQYTTGEVQKTFKGYTVTVELPSTVTADGSSSGSDSIIGSETDSSIGGGIEHGSESGSESASEIEIGNDKIPYDDWRRKLSPIMDMTFPVREFDIIETLTKALLWLNRKVQETVTVDLISPVNNGVPSINHIVDFTERVKLDGNEYFLVSNNISFTPRKLIQKLQLIRWY